jgi:hypothetical protein
MREFSDQYEKMCIIVQNMDGQLTTKANKASLYDIEKKI